MATNGQADARPQPNTFARATSYFLFVITLAIALGFFIIGLGFLAGAYWQAFLWGWEVVQ